MLAWTQEQTIAVNEIPVLPPEAFRTAVAQAVEQGARLAALFAAPRGAVKRVYAVLAWDGRHLLETVAMEPSLGYPSLTPVCPQAHWFEREIFEVHGITPHNHPWLKPIRFHERQDGGERPAPCVTEYFTVDGPEIHEVAVGPVHAGIIEPGHFRFQCLGETVMHLEISLGYQHRGIEAQLPGGPDRRTIHFMETAAGDTTIGHTWAHCALVEALAGVTVPARAQAIRALALELERLANHTGDVGALALDMGFLPTSSFCGRLRGDFLNMTALLCGNRFGRGLVRPGGVAFDVEPERTQELLRRLAATVRDVRGAVRLFVESSMARNRLEGVGALSTGEAVALGLVGPAARACGVVRDDRWAHPQPGVPHPDGAPATAEGGDLLARAMVRVREIEASAAMVEHLLRRLPEGAIACPVPPLAPRRLAACLVEAWRGEVCHVAATDERGRFAWYKMVDPSFHNWFGLAMVLRGTEISDFPLCNKSFNLSYCGHDL